jgi:hypothetical protein
MPEPFLQLPLLLTLFRTAMAMSNTFTRCEQSPVPLDSLEARGGEKVKSLCLTKYHAMKTYSAPD